MNQTSFSIIAKDLKKVKELLGANALDMQGNEIKFEKLIRNQTCPPPLKDGIFEILTEYLDSFQYPAGEDSEASVATLVDIVLIKIVSFLNRATTYGKFIVHKDLEITNGGFLDYAIFKEKMIEKEGKNVYACKYMVIFELKKTEDLTSGINQTMLYLNEIYNEMKDGKDVYGFATNGTTYVLVIFGKSGWKFSQKTDLLSDLMRNDKNSWINNNTLILDCIYSLLIYQSQNY